MYICKLGPGNIKMVPTPMLERNEYEESVKLTEGGFHSTSVSHRLYIHFI